MHIPFRLTLMTMIVLVGCSTAGGGNSGPSGSGSDTRPLAKYTEATYDDRYPSDGKIIYQLRSTQINLLLQQPTDAKGPVSTDTVDACQKSADSAADGCLSVVHANPTPVAVDKRYLVESANEGTVFRNTKFGSTTVDGDDGIFKSVSVTYNDRTAAILGSVGADAAAGFAFGPWGAVAGGIFGLVSAGSSFKGTVRSVPERLNICPGEKIAVSVEEIDRDGKAQAVDKVVPVLPGDWPYILPSTKLPSQTPTTAKKRAPKGKPATDPLATKTDPISARVPNPPAGLFLPTSIDLPADSATDCWHLLHVKKPVQALPHEQVKSDNVAKGADGKAPPRESISGVSEEVMPRDEKLTPEEAALEDRLKKTYGWSSLIPIADASGWLYRVTLDSAIPEGAKTGPIKTSEYFNGKPKDTLPISACYKATLELAWWDLSLRKVFHMQVVNPEYVEAVPMPKTGSINFKTLCGVTVTNGAYTGSTLGAAFDAAIKQAGAIKAAGQTYKKNK